MDSQTLALWQISLACKAIIVIVGFALAFIFLSFRAQRRAKRGKSKNTSLITFDDKPKKIKDDPRWQRANKIKGSWRGED
jgi:hypothetical protein